MNGIPVLSVAVACLLVAGVVFGEEKNLLQNPGFEAPYGENKPPDKWQIFSSLDLRIGTTCTAKHENDQALKFTAQNKPGEFQGAVQRLDIVGGKEYAFEAYMMEDRTNALSGTVKIQVVIEWKQGDTEVGRFCGKMLEKTSKLRWEDIKYKKLRAPKEATLAVVGIHMHEGNKGGEGVVYVDDVKFYQD